MSGKFRILLELREIRGAGRPAGRPGRDLVEGPGGAKVERRWEMVRLHRDRIGIGMDFDRDFNWHHRP